MSKHDNVTLIFTCRLASPASLIRIKLRAALNSPISSARCRRSRMCLKKACILLVQAGACGSRGEANRLIQGGGVYLNNRRTAADHALSEADLASKSMLVLRTGKKSYYLVRFSQD